MARRRPVVAIDGPAGSGKSTTARAVAEAVRFVHLDSGALYRAMTLVALGQPGAPDQWTGEAIVAAARERAVGMVRREDRRAFEVTVGGSSVAEALRTDAVTREVSRVSAMGPVRDFVNGILRDVARDGGVVLDGRDIGTVVFPDAEVKIYLVADATERARRRLAERGRKTDTRSVGAEAEALVRRDEHDSRRTLAPLARAPDAVLLDTTRLSFEEQVKAVVDLVKTKSRG